MVLFLHVAPISSKKNSQIYVRILSEMFICQTSASVGSVVPRRLSVQRLCKRCYQAIPVLRNYFCTKSYSKCSTRERVTQPRGKLNRVRSYVQYGRLLEIHVYMRTTFFSRYYVLCCNKAARITFLLALRTGLAAM